MATVTKTDEHARQLYANLILQPRFAGNPNAAAHEARRLAEEYENPKPFPNAVDDPYRELDMAYCPNLPSDHHINRMSRFMPKPGGKRGDLIERPDLDAALADCRAARKMKPKQLAADHKRCVAQMEQEMARQLAATEQKRIADEEAERATLSRMAMKMIGMSTED